MSHRDGALDPVVGEATHPVVNRDGLVAVSQTFGGHVTRLAADSTGARLLAVVDGRLVVWSRGDRSFAILGDGVTDAAWTSWG